jgi:hypothetical protein
MKNDWHPHLMSNIYELLATHMLPCAIPFKSQFFFSCHEAKEKGFESQNKCRILMILPSIWGAPTFSWVERRKQQRGDVQWIFFLKPNEFKVK